MTTPAQKAAPGGVTYSKLESGRVLVTGQGWAMLIDGPVEVDGEAV